jgi:hypothetical protein
MREFLITKIVTATLLVQCEDEEEARKWAGRIVASLEDESGRPLPPQNEFDFETSVSPNEILVEVME